MLKICRLSYHVRLGLTLNSRELAASRTSTRSLASIKDFFGGGSKKKPTKDGDEETNLLAVETNTSDKEQNLITADFDALRETEVKRLVRVRAYKPGSNVEERIKQICKTVLGPEFKEDNFRETPLSSSLHKFNCIVEFKHNISNTALNDIKRVDDLIKYYLTEQKDTSTLEDLHQRSDLPKNLHINLEYNRFDPEKDTFFGGRDAMPHRDTLVPSLWYSKKYKPVYKKKQMFTK